MIAVVCSFARRLRVYEAFVVDSHNRKTCNYTVALDVYSSLARSTLPETCLLLVS